MYSERKLVIVLGPHRSGTSLCAAAIQCLGANLGTDSFESSDENKKGFYEHPEIVDFNDRLLAHLGGSWDNPLFNGSDAIKNANLDTWVYEAEELFNKIFCGVTVAALKDPRMCQLISFWIPVFHRIGYQPKDIKFVHVVRNPVEVALSQKVRSMSNPDFYEIGKEVEEGAALWLSLTIQIFSQCLGVDSFIVEHQKLVTETENELENLSAFLGLNPPRQKIDEFRKDFLDERLYRSSADPESALRIEKALPQVFDVYNELSALAKSSSRVTKGDSCSLLNTTRFPEIKAAIFDVLAPALSRTIQISRARGPFEEYYESVVEQNRSYVSTLEKQIESLQEENEKLQFENIDINIKFMDQHATVQLLRADLDAKTVTFHRRAANALIDVVRRIHARLSCSPASHWLSIRIFISRLYIRLYQRMPSLARFLRLILRPALRMADKFMLLVRLKWPSDYSGSAGSRRPVEYQRHRHRNRNEYRPLVSVIVPNYNHAQYLSTRLDSIYNQTYENFEVILLDDCSIDDSVEILRSYRDRFPEKTSLIVNDKNSGGVFYQWERGINAASGELVWVAESDDFCQMNFLETLVPYFSNEAINVAYARTVFVKDDEEKPFWTIEEYLHEIDPTLWNNPFVESAHAIVGKAFSIKNIIPNVSSALFRGVESIEILRDPDWKKMRTCGDWVLYLHLLRGGLLAYTPESTNFYRIHGNNTSVSSYSDDLFYQEHEVVAKTVRRYYQVEHKVFETQQRSLIDHWHRTRSDFTDERFKSCYSIERIMTSPGKLPNLLMAGYAFCAGGGETFPIQLANVMKAHGYNVTYMDFNQEPRVPEVRNSLRKDIPVISNFHEIGRIVENLNIDVVHSHHAWVDNTILDLLDERCGCKTVVTLHGMYETVEAGHLASILPRLVQRSGKIVYTAEKNLQALRQHGFIDRAPLIRIDNGLDASPGIPIERSGLGIPESAFLITLVSRAIPEKGWREAIEAVSRAREISCVDIHLILIGEGPMYEEYLQTALPPYIHLLGFRKNIRDYFAASQLGFLPSRFDGESFPLVVIDCIQAGTPVLASSVGEIPYMLEAEGGKAGQLFHLVDGCIDIVEVAKKIADLAVNLDLYGELIKLVPKAAEKFDSSLMCERYDTVYRNIFVSSH